MKHIQLFVALLAVSIFVIPATSMRDNGNAMSDCKPQVELPLGQQQCDCPNAMAGLNNNMMDDKQQKPCEKNAPRGQDIAPKSMMDGKMQKPCEQNAPQGQNIAPKPMMDDKQKPCDQDSEKGPVEGNGPKSMMDNLVPK